MHFSCYSNSWVCEYEYNYKNTAPTAGQSLTDLHCKITLLRAPLYVSIITFTFDYLIWKVFFIVYGSKNKVYLNLVEHLMIAISKILWTLRGFVVVEFIIRTPGIIAFHHSLRELVIVLYVKDLIFLSYNLLYMLV